MSNWQSVCICDIANIPKKRPVANPQAIELLTVRLYAKGIERTGKYPRATERGRPYFAREAGEILIGRQNFHNGGIGIVGKAEHGLICSNAITSLIPTDRADKDFLFYLLSNSEFRKSIQKQSEGTGQSEISETKILSLELLLPPLPEQKKIAEILSGIDCLILAEEKRVLKMKIALEGLANSWEKQVSLVEKDGTIGELITSIDSGWSPSCEEIAPKSGEWGVLKVSAVTKGRFCEEESKRLPSDLLPRKQFLVNKNDLLITRANGNLDLVGRGVIVEKETFANLLMSDKILRLNPKPSCNRNFLLLLLNSRHVRQQIELAVGGSTGAKNIGQSFFRQIAVSIPGVSDQIRIGNLSHSLSTTLVVGRKRLDYLVSLKKGLSSDLLSGRKRVSI
jgi:type I restriction enzyme S subunit